MALEFGQGQPQHPHRRAQSPARRPQPHPRFQPQHRPLSLPEIFTYSSNVGTARLALSVGVEGHKAFLRKMGQLDRMRTELPENAEPIVPRNWSEVSTMTIAFGHGLAVAPLQAMMAVGRPGQWRLSDHADLPQAAGRISTRPSEQRVVRPETSESLRYIMRLNADDRHREKGQYSGLFRRRQDRHGGKGRQRPLQPSTRFSPPSWRSCRPTSRAICS